VATAAKADAAAVGRGYFDAVAARDVEAMAAFWEPGSIDELHGLASLRAPEGVREWFANTFRAVPDFQMKVIDLIAGDDKVAVRWQMTGTFSGDAKFEGRSRPARRSTSPAATCSPSATARSSTTTPT
jgi:predicted ester cyclase